MMNRWCQGCWGLLFLMLPAVLLAGDDDAQRWLDRMSVAMSQMSYQGTFVYVQGDSVQTMRITHVVDDTGARERLSSLSGKRREVVRDAGGVRWTFGEEQSVMADAAIRRPFFPELPVDDARLAAQSYEFRLKGTDRVAGHQVRLLEITPLDDYRYGYSLWLDQQSGLLLQWKLFDSAGRTLAKLTFTDLKIGSEVDRSELVAGKRKDASRQVHSSGLPDEAAAAQGRPTWLAQRVPPGFRLASHRRQTSREQIFEHLVYSDGIAAVSVYVESSESPELQPGLSRLGTTHAFCRKVDDAYVTVIGDVPPRTVKMIAESVAPVAP